MRRGIDPTLFEWTDFPRPGANNAARIGEPVTIDTLLLSLYSYGHSQWKIFA